MQTRIKYSLLLFFALAHLNNALRLGNLGFANISDSARNLGTSVSDVVGSAKDITTGVASNVGDLLPTPRGLFDLSKNVIAGYPFEFVASSINKVCSAALSAESIAPRISPDINKMNFQLRTPCKNYDFPLLEANRVWASPAFDSKKKVVIVASGWTTNINDTNTIDTIGKAYLCRGDVNFIGVDAASFVDTLYTWSAFNTEEIGEHIAHGLVLLADIVPVENIHLIGHSLGAHIMGAAGRYFNYFTGKNIRRITGLDPAKPCFNEGEALSGLMRGDADFIDIIHSNVGVLGKREPLGDVDFYAGGLHPIPPGCLSITCAHNRAVQYYAESIYPEAESNFMAVRCTSMSKKRSNACPGASYPMGFAVPHNIKGNYILEVNEQAPFGKDAKKTNNNELANCGICKLA